jgi:hypothetical protein
MKHYSYISLSEARARSHTDYTITILKWALESFKSGKKKDFGVM